MANRSVFLFLFILITVFTCEAFAQIASASFFKEMRSINPAVLGLRPAAVVSLVGKADEIKKEQDISPMFGDGATNKTEVSIKAANLYYGGQGSGLTNEMLVEYANGKKKDTLKSSNESFNASNDINSTYGKWALGIGEYLGVSAGYLNYDYKDKFSGTFSGSDFSSNVEMKTTAQNYRGGLRGSFIFDFGVYYDYMTYKSDRNIDGEASSVKESFRTVGAGVGLSGKVLRIEGSYEKSLDPEEAQGKKYYGNRIIGTVELQFKNLSLGYAARYYQEGFITLEGLLYNVLVYSRSYDEARLEHVVNFAFGASKGHGFSGSAYYSKTESKEDMTMLVTNEKFKTDITAMGASLKYTYSF